jgi:dihydrofolate synthase/folylpolyglutamate synthase
MSKVFLSFAEVNDALNDYISPVAGMRAYTLDRMQRIMAFLDNPQDKCKAIHVAGTSGKTSTAYYVAAMLQAAGHKVGLTISPHVDEINERVQINLQPLDEATFCKDFSEFLTYIDKAPDRPTYFEVLVAFAYWEFARIGVDYVVVEVGVGGLKDGTNVITRADKVCIITDIGFDHMHVLGSTLAAIAGQKAGIIQHHNEVFMYNQGVEVNESVMARVSAEQAHLHMLEQPKTPADFAFLPLFQQRNILLAQAAADFTLQRDGHGRLTQAMLAQTAHTAIPARMEIRKVQGKTVVIDAAHNPQKLHALAKSLQAQYPDQPVAALVAFGQRKGQSLHDDLIELSSIVRSVIVTSFTTEGDPQHKAVPTEQVTNAAKSTGLQITTIDQPAEALQALLARPEQLLLVTGSFYLLNHVRPLLP